MSCETIHKEGKSRYCQECGKKLFDELCEKMNKELLPELQNISKFWSNGARKGAILVAKIYGFFLVGNHKIPDIIFLDNSDDNEKFLSKDEYFLKYPEHESYMKKILCDSNDYILDIPWIRALPSKGLLNDIINHEKKYGVPIPDKTYDGTFHHRICCIDSLITEKKDKEKEDLKEYLIAIIKKM